MASNNHVTLDVFLRQIFHFWYNAAFFPVIGLDGQEMEGCFLRLLRSLEDGVILPTGHVRDITEAGWTLKNIMLDSLDKAENLLGLTCPCSPTPAGRIVEVAIAVSTRLNAVRARATSPATLDPLAPDHLLPFIEAVAAEERNRPGPPFLNQAPSVASIIAASQQNLDSHLFAPIPRRMDEDREFIAQAIATSPAYCVKHPSTDPLRPDAPPFPPLIPGSPSMMRARNAARAARANALQAAADTVAVASRITDFHEEYLYGAFDADSLTGARLFDMLRPIVPADAFSYARPIPDTNIHVLVCASTAWALGSKGLVVPDRRLRCLTYNQIISLLTLSGNTLHRATPSAGQDAAQGRGISQATSQDASKGTGKGAAATDHVPRSLFAPHPVAPGFHGAAAPLPAARLGRGYTPGGANNIHPLYAGGHGPISTQRTPLYTSRGPYQFPPGSRHAPGPSGLPRWMTGEDGTEGSSSMTTSRRRPPPVVPNTSTLAWANTTIATSSSESSSDGDETGSGSDSDSDSGSSSGSASESDSGIGSGSDRSDFETRMGRCVCRRSGKKSSACQSSRCKNAKATEKLLVVSSLLDVETTRKAKKDKARKGGKRDKKGKRVVRSWDEDSVSASGSDTILLSDHVLSSSDSDADSEAEGWARPHGNSRSRNTTELLVQRKGKGHANAKQKRGHGDFVVVIKAK